MTKTTDPEPLPPQSRPNPDRAQIDSALLAASADAVERHRRLGEPIVVWQDGRVQWLWPQSGGEWTPGGPPVASNASEAPL